VHCQLFNYQLPSQLAALMNTLPHLHSAYKPCP